MSDNYAYVGSQQQPSISTFFDIYLQLFINYN